MLTSLSPSTRRRDFVDAQDGWLTTDPTTVVVLAYKSAQIIESAHAQCAVVQLDADRPADMEAFGAGDMNFKAAVLEYPTGPRFGPCWCWNRESRRPQLNLAATAPVSGCQASSRRA